MTRASPGRWLHEDHDLGEFGIAISDDELTAAKGKELKHLQQFEVYDEITWKKAQNLEEQLQVITSDGPSADRVVAQSKHDWLLRIHR